MDPADSYKSSCIIDLLRIAAALMKVVVIFSPLVGLYITIRCTKNIFGKHRFTKIMVLLGLTFFAHQACQFLEDWFRDGAISLGHVYRDDR